VPLQKVIDIYASHNRTICSLYECELRPLDTIKDLTEEDARRIFTELYDTHTKLDGPEIRQDTPDGTYIGILV